MLYSHLLSPFPPSLSRFHSLSLPLSLSSLLFSCHGLPFSFLSAALLFLSSLFVVFLFLTLSSVFSSFPLFFYSCFSSIFPSSIFVCFPFSPFPTAFSSLSAVLRSLFFLSLPFLSPPLLIPHVSLLPPPFPLYSFLHSLFSLFPFPSSSSSNSPFLLFPSFLAFFVPCFPSPRFLSTPDLSLPISLLPSLPYTCPPFSFWFSSLSPVLPPPFLPPSQLTPLTDSAIAGHVSSSGRKRQEVKRPCANKIYGGGGGGDGGAPGSG